MHSIHCKKLITQCSETAKETTRTVITDRDTFEAISPPGERRLCSAECALFVSGGNNAMTAPWNACAKLPPRCVELS
jgi:hypothetical protein